MIRIGWIVVAFGLFVTALALFELRHDYPFNLIVGGGFGLAVSMVLTLCIFPSISKRRRIKS